MAMSSLILLVVIAYLIGSIPTAYIIVKLVKKIDIRTVGSGNAGATNAARVLGKWGFISVFTIDVLKGFLPVYFTHSYYGNTIIPLIISAVVILGHIYTVFLGFKGGKGVATGAGAFLALAPIPVGIGIVVFLITFLITRMVSAGSILGALAVLISVLIMSDWLALKVLTAIVVFFVIFKHRTNIVRIIKGEENKFERKKKDKKENIENTETDSQNKETENKNAE